MGASLLTLAKSIYYAIAVALKCSVYIVPVFC